MGEPLPRRVPEAEADYLVGDVAHCSSRAAAFEGHLRGWPPILCRRAVQLLHEDKGADQDSIRKHPIAVGQGVFDAGSVSIT